MKIKITATLSILVLLFLASCAHHRDVRPGVDGLHRVVIKTDEKDKGAREAIRQAEHYCKEKKQSAAFVNEDSKYQGDMDEKTYSQAKRVSKVATGVGGAVWALAGSGAVSNAGGVVGLGGAVGNGLLGNAYEVDMKFKCQ